MSLYHGEGKGGRKSLLVKGSAGICSKPRQRGNSHDWVEQLINPFNFQVPRGHNRFCLCFCCCDVSVSERNQPPPSSSCRKFCNLPTEPLSFLKKYKTQYPAPLGARCAVQFWVVEFSRITSQSQQEILICYFIFSLLSFTYIKLMDILWFSYLVLKILFGVWFCFFHTPNTKSFLLMLTGEIEFFSSLNGFCWQDGFRLLTKHTQWAWWPRAVMGCALLAGQIEGVVTKCKQPNPFQW